MVAAVCAVLQHACIIATKDAITYETTNSALYQTKLVLLH
jgi:hypothetical protein